MKKKFNTYWPFGVAFVAIFMLGAYASDAIHGVKEVPVYKFILNVGFAILFLVKGINRVKEL